MSQHTSDAQTVTSRLLNGWDTFAEERALWCDGDWWTYRELGTHVASAVSVLATWGVARGDRVVLALANSVMLRVFELAAIQLGAVRVALSPRLHDREISVIAADCAAKVVLCAPERADGLRAAGTGSTVHAVADAATSGRHDQLTVARLRDTPPSRDVANVDPDDLAMIMYSSGTTGRPKGALVTHRAWLAQLARAARVLPAIGPGDVILLAAPMTHFAGSIGIDGVLWGAASVLHERFDTEHVWNALTAHAVTVLPLAPVHLDLLTKSPLATPSTSVRAVPYGGSTIQTSVAATASRLFPDALTQFYGLAEALAPLASISPSMHERAAENLSAHEPATRATAERHLSSAGHALVPEEIRIVDGELQVRGEIVTSGYWGRPELTATSFDDEWFRTGDAVRLDPDGVLTVLARVDDVIVSGGFNIYPAEVEQAIITIPSITEVVVVGMPDERWGTTVTAAIVAPTVLESEHAELAAAVVAACEARLASYKKPTRMVFFDKIPRNAAGKALRTEIRRRLSSGEETQ